MFKILYSKRTGAVNGAAAAAVSLVTVAAATTALCAAKLTEPKNIAVIMTNGVAETVYTNAESIDSFIAEQRARLHPFDTITYAALGLNGVYEMAVEAAPRVILRDGDNTNEVRAIKGEQLSALLSRAGITLGGYDSVSIPVDHTIDADCEITVTRAFPVTIYADGNEISVLAADITAGELLAREGIILDADDELSCDPDEKVSKGMRLAVTRVLYAGRVKSKKIPYETEHRDSPLLKIGDEQVTTVGVDGVARVYITDRYEDGVLVSSEGSDTVVTEPVNEVISHGTALNTPYSDREGNFTLENGIPTEYEYVLNGKVTAYYAPEGAGTYSGRPLILGSVGVDPDVIPFGTELYIVSEDGKYVYGYAVASDTGDIKGSGVLCDAYMGTTFEDAFRWQAQYCNVYVLKTGDNSVSWR